MVEILHVRDVLHSAIGGRLVVRTTGLEGSSVG